MNCPVLKSSRNLGDNDEADKIATGLLMYRFEKTYEAFFALRYGISHHRQITLYQSKL